MQVNSMMSARTAACLTATALGVVTVGAVMGAVATANTVAMVVYAILATVGVGLSGASVTAAFSEKSRDASSYFTTFQEHAKLGVAATTQLVAQVSFQALLQGLVD